MFHLVFHIGDVDYTNEDEANAAGRAAGLSTIDWDEVDESGHIVAQGGCCLDDECNCRKWWTLWRKERQSRQIPMAQADDMFEP